ncbi:MAG: hypothetical protein WDA72_04675 [Desulfomonilia bacterium]|jgi:hypothetical protein|nr:peptidase MA family metallohydrolase [Deltaproteobacteria bacterium]MDX9760518.1 peptidase MA family metallohydrolase [Desulfomonilia bacterium]HPW68896.1 peptidase MA family metallohydrolase [Deltaproteobacteria bacterium]
MNLSYASRETARERFSRTGTWGTRIGWNLSGLLVALVLCLLAGASQAQEYRVMDGPDIQVLYADPSLEPSAREVIGRYPSLKKGLESVFLWEMDFHPRVLLVSDRRSFLMMAGHEAFVAYAVPEKQLVVIDATRMGVRPFTLETTLKHELCHLLLHHHITRVHLPKWLDEGVCQWISEGIPEIVFSRGSSPLPAAVLTGALIPLESLSHHFPRDRRGLLLSYEQSRSVVEYIVNAYGRKGILNILQSMKSGVSAQDAVQMALMIPLRDLEMQWRDDLRSWPVLLAFFAGNLYTIIFLLAAVLTFLAYVRFLLRKRRYLREMDDPDQETPEHGEDRGDWQG